SKRDWSSDVCSSDLENAKRLADFFQKHPKVAEVFYPGLSSHDGFETAQKQMSGFGGMISFLVDGDREEALKIVSGAQLISRATSLGGVESTWEHRRSSVGEDSRAPENMIRIGVGLEHPEGLMEDWEQAFASCTICYKSVIFAWLLEFLIIRYR